MWICLGMGGLFLLLSGGAYWISCYNPRSRRGDPLQVPQDGDYRGRGRIIRLWMEEMAQCPGEPVSIRSEDGEILGGTWYPRGNYAPVLILVHGYRSNGLRDVCGLWRIARANGQNVLVVDQRSHGRSGGNTLTFGVREGADCRKWAEYVASRCPGRPIFLGGVSMGGATVLMAAGENLPPAVRGILADCAYTSAREVVVKIAGDLRLPPRIVWSLVVVGGFLYGHFDIRKAETLPAVEKTHLPLLLIHGAEDRIIPSKMANSLANRCGGPVFLALFPQAGHGHSCPWDVERYERLYREFVHHALNPRD